jgi:uncharacterized protein YfaS (alpha-2-macroglobulin family)
VVLDDPLPAGLEALDASLAHGASWNDLGDAESGADGEDDQRYFWRAPLTRKEIHDDRVLFFADEMEPGVHHYRYLARATSIGTFSAPPSRVEEMYVPETFGFTAGARLEVTQ